MATVKFRSCTQTQYDNGSKDSNTIYFITNQYRVYKGNILLLDRTRYGVIFALSSDDGQIDFSTKKIKYRTSTGTSLKELSLDENGCAGLDAATSTTWVFTFPEIEGYSKLPDVTITGTQVPRLMVKEYKRLAGLVRSVVLERSNPDQWYTEGDDAVVDYFINQGTYVINEINRKYAKLSPKDHSKFEDGTTYDGSYGNVFKYIPTMYYKMTTNSNSEPVLLISQTPIVGGESWGESWIGTYKASISTTNSLTSLPGLTTVNYNLTTMFAAAHDNLVCYGGGIGVNDNYGLMSYWDECKIKALYLAKYGTPKNVRGTINSSTNFVTGSTKTLGDSTGTYQYAQDTTKTVDKLFGIEGLTTGKAELRQNIYGVGGPLIIYIYNGTPDNKGASRAFSSIGRNYYGVTVLNMVLGQYCDFIPKSIGGTTTTYYCSNTQGLGGTSGNENVTFGGCYPGGIFYIQVWVNSSTTYGSRLAFKGDISNYTLVNGANLNS